MKKLGAMTLVVAFLSPAASAHAKDKSVSDENPWLAKTDCKDLEAAFQSDYTYSSGRPKAEQLAGDLAIAKRFVECGQYPALFENVIKFESEATDLLSEMEKTLPVFDKLAAYLGSGKPVFTDESKGTRSSAWQISKWLIATKKAAQCKAVQAGIAKMPASESTNFLDFFLAAGCREAAVFTALKHLPVEDPDLRSKACDVLGKLGTKAHISKLEIVAKTDPSHSDVGDQKHYPVRERCLAAIGQIKLRE